MFRMSMLVALLATPLMAQPEKPKLVVLVVFDQMRGDYLDKWRPYFGPDGFIRMQTEGAWFDNCHYPYGVTVTGAGHSSFLTGCDPSEHGIIGNTWYDRRSGKVVNCSESDRYARVPALPKDLPKDELRDDVKAAEAKQKKDEPKKEAEKPEEEAKKTDTTPKPKPQGTPDRMLAPTLGDALKLATANRGKVFGLSFKDRSAVLPVGAKADGAYWLDSADGMIVTSTFFRDASHAWVSDFNRARVADRWFGKTWQHLRDDVDYVRQSGPDKMPGEGKGSRQGVEFPHRMDGGLKRVGKAYYDALFNSPFGNELLLELAKTCITAEKLGQDEHPDLLSVSFSSNDSVGHCWGPDSQEVLDTTLRSDRMMAEFLKFLDDKVGKGNYLLCLSADHGICPIPEVAALHGLDAKRVPVKKYLTEAETYLRTKFEKDRTSDSKTRWIENTTAPWVYLNQRLIESKKLDASAVARELAEFLSRQEGVQRTFTREQLTALTDRYDDVGRRMQKSFHPDRSGDVAIVLKPYHLDNDSRFATGTTHGSPHPYDTHVPLLVFGANVQPGRRHDDAVPAMIAAIMAQGLGIAAPAKSIYPAPDLLFKK